MGQNKLSRLNRTALDSNAAQDIAGLFADISSTADSGGSKIRTFLEHYPENLSSSMAQEYISEIESLLNQLKAKL